MNDHPPLPFQPNFWNQDPDSASDALSYAQWIAFAPTVFQASRTLISTGVLKALDASRPKGLSAEELRAKTGLSEYGLRVLLEAALGIGLVQEKEARYHITQTSRFLIRNGMIKANMDFSHDVTYHGMFDLEASIRNGKPEGLKHFGTWNTVYEALAHLPEPVRQSWFAFDHYYSDMAFDSALKLVLKDAPGRLLDIGGNTGKWALRCLKHDSNIHVGLFDLPGQLRMAKKTLADAGFSGRTSLHEGNLLNESSGLPEGYDVIWMSQFLDCFSEDQIVSILQRCKAVLKPGARIQILEVFWDRQTFPAGSFALQMTSLYFTAIANGNSQMYRSSVFIDCVKRAGLVIEHDTDNVGLFHTLLTCRAA